MSDQRCEGINLRFTDNMENFLIVLLEQNLSKTTTQVQNAIKTGLKSNVAMAPYTIH